jgi:hypothetical protein
MPPAFVARVTALLGSARAGNKHSHVCLLARIAAARPVALLLVKSVNIGGLIYN